MMLWSFKLWGKPDGLAIFDCETHNFVVKDVLEIDDEPQSAD